MGNEEIWSPSTDRPKICVMDIDLPLCQISYKSLQGFRLHACTTVYSAIFTARSSYASAVLEVVILSVCPSVSHTRALCDETKKRIADILISYERVITLVSWYQQRLMGDVPFYLNCALKMTHTSFEKRRLRPVSAYKVWNVSASEKCLINANRKSTTRFPTSYRWSAYVTPNSPKGGSKSEIVI